MANEQLQPLDQNVAIVFIDALLYGIYFTTLLHCVRWLVFADEGWKLRRKMDIQWAMLLATLLLFLFSLGNFVLEVWYTLLTLRRIDRGSDVTAAVQKPGWLALVTCTNANLSILVGDLVMMHRCYVIYNRSRRILAFPILLWLGGILLTALQAYWQIVQVQHIIGVWQPINSTVGPGTILTPFWGTTILLNGYTSGLIIYRIWRVANNSAKLGASTDQIRFVMRVLIESGILYLSTTIAHFTVWWTPNNFAIGLVSKINLQIVGITFNLIFIRLGQRRVDNDTSHAEFNNVNLSGMQFAINKGAYQPKQQESSYESSI